MKTAFAVLAMVLAVLAAGCSAATVTRTVPASSGSSTPAPASSGKSAECIRAYGPKFPYLVGNHCEASPSTAAPAPVVTETVTAPAPSNSPESTSTACPGINCTQQATAPAPSPTSTGATMNFTCTMSADGNSYTVVGTNTSSVSATDVALTVSFTDDSGNEVGSETSVPFALAVLPGQTLTLNESMTANAPGATNCTVASWSGGSGS